MSASSYESLAGKSELLWYLLDSILTATDALANKDYKAYLQIELADGTTLTTLALRKKIKKFNELVLNNDLINLRFSVFDTTRPGMMEPHQELAKIYIHNYDISSIELSVKDWYINDARKQQFQNLFIDLLFKVCKKIEVVTGYITHDLLIPGFTTTPHERHSIGRFGQYSEKDYIDHFRGYFWGNLLSERHIQTLGGLGSIVHNAPCYQVKEISRQNVYLQLTESVFEFSDRELSNLKEYFRPILLPKRGPTDPSGYNYLRYIPDKEE